MSRHSKNNTANAVFTYAEKKMLKNVWGTKEQRLGTDSQRSFEQCHLCLKKCDIPMVCEQGHIFCKVCIVENLVQQKKMNQQKLQKWQQLKQDLEQQEQQQNQSIEQKKIEHFERIEYYNDSSSKINQDLIKDNLEQMNADSKKRISQKTFEQMQENKEFLKNRDFSNQHCPSENGIKNNFWMMENHKGVQQKLGEMPNLNCICPGDNKHKISFKKIYQARLETIAGTDDGNFNCFACKREFKYQKVAMPKKCGHLMCKTCIESICYPEKKCIICRVPCATEQDIIVLQQGQSSFANHGKAQGIKFAPAFAVV